MNPKSPRWVEDITDSCANILAWTVGSNLSDYQSNAMLRAAVERSFEIIGEALLRLERNDPDLAARITDYRRIIGFRNRLAHKYEDTDHELVWEIISAYVPALRAETAALLVEIDSEHH
jgi:uncharacterized protein with HEPN domain